VLSIALRNVCLLLDHCSISSSHDPPLEHVVGLSTAVALLGGP
jgi:hypothetical protein